jgi:hypothetical protein
MRIGEEEKKREGEEEEKDCNEINMSKAEEFIYVYARECTLFSVPVRRFLFQFVQGL